jgi:hypothetical protein
VVFQQAGLGKSAASLAHRPATDAEPCRERELVDAPAAFQLVREDHPFDLGMADVYQRLGASQFHSVFGA